jgi:hypothetical protein
MMTRKFVAVAMMPFALLASNISQAHSGAHTVSSFSEAIEHMLTEPFHLALIGVAVAGGIVAFSLWRKSRSR